jgi:hypothetical protein
MKTARYAMAPLLLVTTVANATCPSAPNNNFNEAKKAGLDMLATTKLSIQLSCDPKAKINDLSPCNRFVGKGLVDVYGVQDFVHGGGYLTANAIFDYVSTAGNGWKSIGILADADNSLCAQYLANKGTPVIAVIKGAVHGHVAMVLPGEPKTSQTWGGFAPNSAAFKYERPTSAQTYVNERLSLAFTAGDAHKAMYFYRDK